MDTGVEMAEEETGTGIAKTSDHQHEELAQVSRIATLSTRDARATHTLAATSKRNRWFKLRYLFVFAVLGWAVCYYWFTQYPQYKQLADKQAALQVNLDDANKQHQALMQQSQQFQNDDFIARYMSEHYNLILPGQVSFDVKH